MPPKISQEAREAVLEAAEEAKVDDLIRSINHISKDGHLELSSKEYAILLSEADVFESRLRSHRAYRDPETNYLLELVQSDILFADIGDRLRGEITDNLESYKKTWNKTVIKAIDFETRLEVLASFTDSSLVALLKATKQQYLLIDPEATKEIADYDSIDRSKEVPRTKFG